MNDESGPERGMRLAERVRAAFEGRVGEHVILQVRATAGDPQHPTLVFRPKGGRRNHAYLAEPIDTLDAATLAKVMRDWRPEAGRLVIAPHVASLQAGRLKQAGIPFLDAAGNAHLVWPGFFLFTTGFVPDRDFDPPRPVRTPRLFKPAGLRVLFVLLTRPDYLNKTYREIAEVADVALGTVAWVMADLKVQGHLFVPDRQPKRLKKRDRLIEEWTTAYLRELHPRRKVWRFRAENPEWWKAADVREFGFLWGGDVAGDRLTGHLKPVEFTVYANGIPERLLQAQRMRADPHGDVAIVERFWNFPPDEAEKDSVPPLLVCADLMATGDPRAIEIAKQIHERYLARPDGEA